MLIIVILPNNPPLNIRNKLHRGIIVTKIKKNTLGLEVVALSSTCTKIVARTLSLGNTRGRLEGAKALPL